MSRDGVGGGGDDSELPKNDEELIERRLEEVADLTHDLRASEEPGWRALRAHMTLQGLEPAQCAVAEWYPDDARTVCVSVVALDRRAFECDVRNQIEGYLHFPHGRVEVIRVKQLPPDVWELADTAELWAARRFLERES